MFIERYNTGLDNSCMRKLSNCSTYSTCMLMFVLQTVTLESRLLSVSHGLIVSLVRVLSFPLRLTHCANGRPSNYLPATDDRSFVWRRPYSKAIGVLPRCCSRACPTRWRPRSINWTPNNASSWRLAWQSSNRSARRVPVWVRATAMRRVLDQQCMQSCASLSPFLRVLLATALFYDHSFLSMATLVPAQECRWTRCSFLWQSVSLNAWRVWAMAMLVLDQ